MKIFLSAKWYVHLIGYVISRMQTANFTLIPVKFTLIGLDVLGKITNMM